MHAGTNRWCTSLGFGMGGDVVTAALQKCAGGADRFAVVDVETTGVYQSDRIVEIAIVTVSLNGEILDVFDTLVQPQRDVAATHIHGIAASMVANAPTFTEIAGDVAVRLHGACFVAHNVPFDSRMLVNEFRLIDGDLDIARGIDTLAEAGCRLGEACAQRDILLDGAHRALSDAMATAQLFLRLADTCDPGAIIAAPVGYLRGGRVRRREDQEPAKIPDSPLIAYLASRLPHTGVEVRSLEYLEYLELLGRAVADRHIDAAERCQLTEFAAELGLTEAELARAHRRYLNELIEAVIADSEVTEDEYDTLVRVAAALDLNQDIVEARVHPYRSVECGVTLQAGMTIVFTGDHPRFSRDELRAFAVDLGLVPQTGVSRTTSIVAAVDAQTNSGKAGKARRYGIPVITVADLLAGQEGVTLAGRGVRAASLKVITCPDCLATWTVPATSGSQARRRCEPCSALTMPFLRHSKPKAVRGMWDPPAIEWLTCQTCHQTWHREVVKGRKPHLCATCSSRH